MRRGSSNEWSRLDQGNSMPVHLPRTSSTQSSGYGNLMPQSGSGPIDWQRNHRFPVSSVQQPSAARFGATTGTPQFEENAIARRNPGSSIGFAFEPHPPAPTVLNSMARETGPRMAPFPRDLPPRLPWLQDNAHNIQGREDITKMEREKALKMLKKKVYSSEPKNLARRLSLYYNYNAGNNNATIRGRGNETNEDGKRCTICLDDFEPGTEVMVTPCDHMFHEDCIIPWLKSHGQCPVCRFVISEQIKENAMALSSRNAPPILPVQDDPFISDHVLSIIIAMDEAFSWGRLH